MKSYLWIPIALLAGLMIGAWGPTNEVRNLEKELHSARKLAKSGDGRRARIDGVTQFLGIAGTQPSPVEPATSTSRTPTNAASSNPGDAPVEAQDAASVAVNTEETQTVAFTIGNGQTATNRPRARNLSEQIERAADLWRMRSDIAHAAFVSDAKLTPEDTDTFDMLMDAMNLRLANSIEIWVDRVNKGMEPGPEAGLRLVSDMTAALVLTYDEMDRTLSTDWRKNSETPLNLTDFINPAVAKPLTQIEDALESSDRW